MVSTGTRHMWQQGAAVLIVVAIAVGVSACASGRSFLHGNEAALQNNWDLAVTYYQKAVEEHPTRADYKMALERAQMSASQLHFERARGLEAKDQLDLALLEYRKVVEYHPANQEAHSKIQTLEQTIRDRIEASRPRPAVEGMREKARQSIGEPVLDPTSRSPLVLKFPNRQLREVLDFIRESTGINVAYDSGFQDRQVTVDIDGVNLEQALHQILTVNGYFYKVLNPRSIIIIQDNAQKRLFYEEQAVQTFYVSHADPTELVTLLNTVVQSQQQGVRPTFAANKTSNSITVRASLPMLQLIERIIAMNDKPRAEIAIDVEILEVDKGNAKQYGLDLSSWSLPLVFSPETRPSASGSSGSSGSTTTVTDTSFNLNTISAGVSTADFYSAVPQAVMRFLETDSQTKVLAKPTLRGQEGEKLSLKLGQEIPVPNTTFYNPYGSSGGVATTPLTSFTYKNVGVNVELEPRVTFEGDIVMKLAVEISAKGADTNVAGQNLPSFTTRKVESRIRLRDGESNLLAGLLQENERKSLKGFPGAIHVPILKQFFSSNDNEIQQTDIVMLITPHIVRTHELTQKDFAPIYIGTQQNLGLTGPPPLIQPAAAPATAQPGPAAQPPPGVTATPTVPRGTPNVQLPPTTPVAGAVPGAASPAPVTQAPARPSVPVEGQTRTPGQTPVAPVAVPAQAAAPPTPAANPVSPEPVAPAQPAPPPAQAGPPAAPPQVAQPAVLDSTRIAPTVPAGPAVVAGAPITVPINVTGASRLSRVTLSLRYNPKVLRARLVQEGTFMRSGGSTVTFANQVDAAGGRVDITITRANDATGTTGDGMLAAVVFDAVGAGESQVALGGVISGPGGVPMPVQFGQARVTVK
ncbi:MAG: hypothetical protein NTY02_15225 [Acidobacteria bacterium]|nr:hypothetical protein [Acidobacteriota bacterium]